MNALNPARLELEIGLRWVPAAQTAAGEIPRQTYVRGEPLIPNKTQLGFTSVWREKEALVWVENMPFITYASSGGGMWVVGHG